MIKLARPERLNAMNPLFFSEFERAAAELGGTEGIRAIVVGGKGQHFSAGLDLKESALLGLGGPSAQVARATYREVRDLQRSFSVLNGLAQPSIAAVTGYCIGGGLDLAAACDLRVASADALFSLREAKMAMVADLGSLQRLPAIIGRGHLMEMALTGGDIDALRAREIGLVNHVLDDADATWNKALEIAAAIAANSPLATSGTKAIIAGVYDSRLEADLDRVALWNSAFLRSADLAEAIAAFAAKREPRFQGE